MSESWLTRKLLELLQLQAVLATVPAEDDLLGRAVERVARLLDLTGVRCYERREPGATWLLRAAFPAADPADEAVCRLLLEELTAGPPGTVLAREGWRARLLQAGGDAPGALLTRAMGDQPALELLLEPFAAGLAALWLNNRRLEAERTRRRALEAEHDHALDELWQGRGELQARYDAGRLDLRRAPDRPAAPAAHGPAGDSGATAFPLLLGDRPLGRLSLPDAGPLTPAEETLVQTVLREMGAALQSARRLQTTQAHSLRLQAAAEVSRAISGFLDPDALVEEVVRQIQRRFNYHHVGLFAVSGDLAALQAGAGPENLSWPPGAYTVSLAPATLLGRAVRQGRPLVEQPRVPTDPRDPLPAALAGTRSQLALPLRIRGEVRGLLDIHSAVEQAFAGDEIAVLQALAAQVAVALDNAALFSQVQLSYLRANQLYQAGQRMQAAAGADGVLQALVDFAAAGGGPLIDLACVLTPDPIAPGFAQISHFWSRVSFELHPRERRLPRDAFPLPDPSGPAEPLIMPDGQAGGRLQLEARRLLRRFNMRGVAVLPIPAEAGWVGSLVLAQRDGRPAADGLTPERLRPFSTLCGQAGLALVNARLFRQTQEQLAELRLLFAVSQAATAGIDLRERLQFIVRTLSDGLRGATVALYGQGSDERGDGLDLLATSGALSLEDSAALTGLLPRLVERSGPQPMERPGAPSASLPAVAIRVPLRLGDRLVGLLAVYHADTGSLTHRDARLLETLSLSLAATIETNRIVATIRATNERLRELDILKTRFLANMSHEFRTPLNAIIGFAGVLLKGMSGPLTAQQAEDLLAVQQNGQHLLMLVNDVLDMAKIEAGQIDIYFEPVELPRLAEAIRSTMRGLLADKPVSFVVEAADDLPVIEADATRLRQILLNLLSNAARYTSAGEIACRIRRDGPDHVLLVVSDTGSGISPEEQENLFRPFVQTEAAGRVGQGTGLGLPITRHLVLMHHGAIRLESAPGEGARFYVRLPIRQPGA